VDEYFNGSTGDGDEGDTDMRGPWTSSYGLHLVDSKLNGGKGLSVGDINGKIEGEDRGKQDEAQKATTSPGNKAIAKKPSKGSKGRDSEGRTAAKKSSHLA
jgi:Mn-containing catalase